MKLFNQAFLNVNKRNVIISHAKCSDGLMSASIAVNKLGKENTEVHFFDHIFKPEDELPKLSSYNTIINEECVLYILDYALPPSLVESLLKQNEKLNVVFIDHHKTAFEEYTPDVIESLTNAFNERIVIVLDNDHSAAVLTYMYFYPEEEVPQCVLYVEDRDIWKNEFGQMSEAFAVAFKTMCSTVDDVIQRFFNPHHDTVNATLQTVEMGESMLKYHMSNVHSLLNNTEDVSVIIDGKTYPGKVVNVTSPFTSDIGHLMAKMDGCYFGLVYSNVKGKWKWGIRSIDDFDTTIISKKFGGGGHLNASGFKTDTLDVLEEFKSGLVISY